MNIPSSTKAVRRSSLPLTAQDEADLELLRGQPELLEDLGVDPSPTEAALLHAIHEAGVRALKDRMEELGYAELADVLRDEMSADEKASRKQRRRRQISR